MYNLLVSHQIEDWNGGTLSFPKARFLEYTSNFLRDQLQSLSAEAIDCIKSWPCVLMREGRGDELAQIGQITEVRNTVAQIALTIEVSSDNDPILNDQLWRIRADLDIEQFEFGRNHWSIKDRDLFRILANAGHQFDASIVGRFEAKLLPAPDRPTLFSARDAISQWSHSAIDDFLLEAGIDELRAEQSLGSRRKRANAIINFSLQNPSATTAENSLFSAFVVRRALPEVQVSDKPHMRVFPVGLGEESRPNREDTSSDRAPNRVFVVHGQNDAARSEVVAFLERLGLVGIVLHEQPNMGRHLLTKFIDEADLATFAIVLMTDDDVGALKGGDLAPRARQNVILELGYFLSHLGQERICALITPGLETPSDFDGIAYIRMDDGQSWQGELRRELMAARMPVNVRSGLMNADRHTGRRH